MTTNYSNSVHDVPKTDFNYNTSQMTFSYASDELGRSQCLQNPTISGTTKHIMNLGEVQVHDAKKSAPTMFYTA